MDNAQINEFDFSGRSSESIKTILCCAFKTKPSSCDTTLSTEQAAKSFSLAYSSGTSTAQATSCE